MKIAQANNPVDEIFKAYKRQIMNMREVINDGSLLSRKYKIKYKEQTLYAELGNIDMDTIFNFRKCQTKDKISNIRFEDCLYEFSDELSYCKESNKVYIGIDRDVTEYLDKHDCSDLIYRIASRTTAILPLDGEIIKIYDTFIKKEKSIRNKKDVLLVNNNIQSRDTFWVLRYLEKIYIKETSIKLTYSQLVILKSHAEEANIPLSELIYRYKLNVSKGISTNEEYTICLRDALNTCIDEAKKYGLAWNDDNGNFIAYIKYLAKQEEIEGDNK